jgi:iron complex outermembrane recepter protein
MPHTHVHLRRLMLLVLTAPLALPALSAVAQTKSTGVELEEVVVTAQRVERNLQSTPVAVTAISRDFLDLFDLRKITSLQNAAPNLVFNPGTGGSSSQINPFIRGIGETDFILTTDPAVGTYVDGVYMARSFGATLELADVERVEVLRGPQGTLFGKNNIGGAISITTRKPTGSGESDLQVSTGNYGSVYADVYTDQALSDTLSLGVAMLYRKSDGWQVRPGPNGAEENKVGGRATLAWRPSGSFESTLGLEIISQNQASNANVMLNFEPAGNFFSPLFNGFVAPTTPPAPPTCCTPNSLTQSFAQGSLNIDNLHGYSVAWTNSWQPSSTFQLKSITSVRNTHANFGRDGDNGAFNYNGDVHDEHSDQVSQELQASGSLDRIKWVGGVYYFKERTHDQTQLVTASGLYDALNGLIGIPGLLDDIPNNPLAQLYLARYALDFNLDFDNRQTTEDYAAYINGTFSVTDRFAIEAGIRDTSEKKVFNQYALRRESNSSLFLPTNPFTGQLDESNVTPPTSKCSDVYASGTRYDCEASWSNVSPRLGFTYQWSDDVFGYAAASKGFRSGGFDGRPTELSGVHDFKPENLTSYEFGLKTLLADHRLRLNTSVFYNKYDDKQVLLVFGTTVVTQNAAKATIYGFETDMDAAVTEHFTLRGSLGYNHGRYDKWLDPNAPGGPADYSSRKLANAPEWTANLAGVYDVPLNGGAVVRLLGNVSYAADMFLNAQNSAILHAGSRTISDAGIFYVADRGRWQVGAEVKNVTDAKVLVGGFDVISFFGYAEGYYNPPRRYFLTFKYKTQ